MKKKILMAALFVLALGLSVWAVSQVADKAVDPVCGMSVAKDGAKWTYDYKGTTYYFCNEACKTGFVKDPEKYLAKMAEAKKVEVEKVVSAVPCEKAAAAACQKEGEKPAAQNQKECGMMAGAAPQAQMPARQWCCCCCCMRMAGGKNMPAHPMLPTPPVPPTPPTAQTPPMQGHMGMMPGMMGRRPMGFGLMNMEDLEKKIETTKDGVIITLSSKNPETVKKIQEHIAKMAEREANMMNIMKQNCGMKKEIKVEIKEVKEDKK
ncbi:MAG: YHS domain-containing protein [Candidatus Aminicenantes bacterium]|nr:YHS domain-containing protein [Candidatus Aminicenantes bacterium]